MRIAGHFILPACLAALIACSASGEQDPAEIDAAIDSVVAKLVAEARELDELKDPEAPPVWKRPHPAMKGWDERMGEPVLDRIGKKFTGNVYRDTYVRWHLIWAVQNMLEERFERFKAGEGHAVPPDIGERLVKLVRAMPGEIRVDYVPWYKHVPEEIYRRWYALHASTYIKVGFPPFEHQYWDRAALPFHPASKQEEMKRILAEIERLRPLFETVYDPVAVKYNDRIEQMNLSLREYRGDLLYAIMQAGDGAKLKLVTNEIGKQIGDRQWVGLDLMAYMYMAAYDGYLSLYDDDLLTAVSKVLERIARGADESDVYMRGREPMPDHVIPRRRNFADFTFHMAEMLESPQRLKPFLAEIKQEGEQPVPEKPDGGFTAAGLTYEQIRRAIDAAVHELRYPRVENRNLLPHYALRSHRVLWKIIHQGGISTPEYQEIINERGNQALVSWALLSEGESFQDPRLYKRINWVLSFDTPFTYDRGMRLMMLAELPSSRWGQYARRDVSWLTRGLSENGNWGHAWYGDKKNDGYGDHANGQYGVLGLWAAQRSGVEIPLPVWRRIDRHWRLTQQRTPGDEPAGWAVGMLNVEGVNDSEDVPPFYKTVNGPMTAGGVATLTLTERYLHGPERTDPRRDNVSLPLRKGIAWLNAHFDMKQVTAESDWFYYMWSVQRVGQATGFRTFNGTDWFREVTAEMLNRQEPDGLWRDPSGKQGTLLSTGFALLYLGNATRPIAISKIRFDGNWNNRPHDLWNFTEHVSGLYEVDTAWRIVDLDQPVYELIESPLLYLASDKGFELSDARVARLREYIRAGGMLLLNPEAGDAGVARSLRLLGERLFPGLKWEQVDRKSTLYNLHAAVRRSGQMKMLHNGVRPLVISFARDLGAGLQSNDVDSSESFAALSNVYLYAVGKRPRRIRLVSDHVTAAGRPTSRSMRVARVKYDGTFDPEPGAAAQLRAVLANDHAVDLSVDPVSPAELGDHKMALLSTVAGGRLTSGEAAAIRAWLEGGGTLWMDAAGGSQGAVDALAAMAAAIFPEAVPLPLPADDPIIGGAALAGGFDNSTVTYRRQLLARMGASTTPRLLAVSIGDRPAIIYSPEDLSAGLAGLQHWDVLGYSVQSARRLLINGVLSAHR